MANTLCDTNHEVAPLPIQRDRQDIFNLSYKITAYKITSQQEDSVKMSEKNRD